MYLVKSVTRLSALINIDKMYNHSRYRQGSVGYAVAGYGYSTESSSSFTESSSDAPPLVYTDGCCFRNGRGLPAAGYGIWWGEDDERNQCGPLLGKYPTNNQAELVAVLLAIEQAIELEYESLTICTDSTYVMNAFTEWIGNWKENGWTNSRGNPVKNQNLIRQIDGLMEDIDVDFEHVTAHDGVYGNECADALAKTGAAEHPNF